MIKLAIATSVRANDAFCAKVHVGYSESVRALLKMYPSAEEVPVTITYGCDNIRARNRVSALVLREFPSVTHILWWDDDQWPEDVRIVQAMLSTGDDVIGAAYTRKGNPVQWVHQEHYDGPRDGVIHEVRALGMGFTITSRRAIERLSSQARKYWDAPSPYEIPDIFGLLYDSTPDGRDVLLSEDFSFCKRWRDSGGRVMVYTGGVVVHAGSYGYTARDIR